MNYRDCLQDLDINELPRLLTLGTQDLDIYELPMLLTGLGHQ